jgi:predicted nucleotidyltransferase
MNKSLPDIIPRFKSAIRELYGEGLSQVILFGSYARGEEKEDSDMDFLVVLKGKDISVLSEIEKINNRIYSLILETGKMISFVPVSEERFEKSPNFFYSQIKREGRVI